MVMKWKIVLITANLCALCTGFGASDVFLEDGKDWLQYSYIPKLEGFVKLHTEPADWHSARVRCHMEGAFLISPWFAKFTSVISKLQTGQSELKMLYSGVQKTFAEGALTHVEGKLIISMDPSETMKLERCGIFLAGGSTGEVDCDTLLPFICYKPASDPEVDVNTESITESPYTTSTTAVYNFTTESAYTTLTTAVYNSATESYTTSAVTFTPSTSESVNELGYTSALAQSSNCGEASLGYEFSKQTGHCYKFHAHAAHTWYDAKAACEEEGGHLAIINSDVEAQVLKELFAKYPAEKIYGAQFSETAAIGYLKNYDGDWVTLNDESLEEAGYASWKLGDPHPWATLGFINRDGLLCAFVPAIRDEPFICEKEPSGQESSTTTNKDNKTNQEATTTEHKLIEVSEPNYGDLETDETPNQETTSIYDKSLSPALALTKAANCEGLGYEFSKQTGQCYKFHAHAAHTWHDAKAACEEEGGHLAMINSDVEAQVLKELFAKYPAEKIYGAHFSETAAIGYLKKYDGDWVTLNDESLEEAGYASWKLGDPHPSATLGFINRDGLLCAFVPAIRDEPFICEKEPSGQESSTTTNNNNQEETTTEEETNQTTDKKIEPTTNKPVAKTTEDYSYYDNYVDADDDYGIFAPSNPHRYRIRY